MKRIFMALTMVFVLVGSVFLSACSKGKDEDGEQGYVSLDINPSVELVIDEDGKVLKVYGANEDAQVLLYEESGIVGESVETAIAKITTLAKELGYLSEDNDTVGVLSSNIDEDLLSSINSTITATAKNLGLNVTTDAEGAYSLVKQFEEYKAKFPNNQAIQSLTISKFKLALSVSETGEITLDNAVELDDSKLIEMLDSNLNKVENYMTDEFKRAKAEAENVFEQAKLLAEDAAYALYFSQNMLQHPTSSYYGALYQMYHTSGKGFELIANAVELSKQVKNYELDATQVQEIATSLGMSSDEIDNLKNDSGVITIESVENYVDKLFKNNKNEDWTQVKASLNETLNEIETTIEAEYAKVSEFYVPRIEAIIAQADAALTTVKTMKGTIAGLPLTETIVAELETYISDYESIVNDIKAIIDDTELDFDVETLKAKAAALLEKAEDVKENMEAELSPEEKEDLETLKRNAVDALTTAKQALENAISQAETSAKQFLNRLKEGRKNK